MKSIMIEINGPVTGEKFVFVFVGEEGDIFTFNHWSQIADRAHKLRISRKSVQQFLRNAAIHPPYTIYENVLMLPVGSSVLIDPASGSIQWRNNFKFLDRDSRQDSVSTVNEFETRMVNAFAPIVNQSRPVYVMQSAGKDSAAMLLGLRKSGAENVTCLTYEANYRDRESGPAKKIAESLGFKHIVVEPDYKAEYEALNRFSGQSYGITGDFALLPYVRVNDSIIPNSSVLVDGLGNDMYMGYVSPSIERRLMKCSMPRLKAFEPTTFFRDNRLSYAQFSLFLEPYERVFPGTRLSIPEIRELTGHNYVDNNVEYFRHLYKTLDKDDFRVAVRARLCDSSQFQMKGELASDAFGNSIYFPFSNPDLVDYYFNLPLQERYDKANRLNKALLRKYIGERISVDEYFITKSGFRYDICQFVRENSSDIEELIVGCDAFVSSFSEKWIKSALNYVDNYAIASKIYVAVVLSSWIKAHPYPYSDTHVADSFDWYGLG